MISLKTIWAPNKTSHLLPDNESETERGSQMASVLLKQREFFWGRTSCSQLISLNECLNIEKLIRVLTRTEPESITGTFRFCNYDYYWS